MNRRFDLFLSLAMLCRISNAQSEVELAAVTDRTHRELAGYHRQIAFHLEKGAQRIVGDEMNALLTIHDSIHILDETVNHFENFRCGSTGLILRESI